MTTSISSPNEPFNAPGTNQAKDPVTKLPRFIEARELYMQGDFDAAEKIFEELNKEHHENPYIMSYLAIFCAERKEWARADHFFLKATKQSDDPMLLVNFGMCLDQQHKYDAALKCFNKALKIDPELQPAYIQMVHTLFMRGDFDTCERAIQLGLKRFPDNLALISRQLNIHLVRGDTQEGTALTQKYIDQHPNDNELFRLIMEFDTLPYDHPAAEYARKLVQETERPDSKIVPKPGINAGFTLFRFYEKHKEYETAFDYLERANAMHRDTIDYSQDVIDNMFRLKMESYDEDIITEEQEMKAKEMYPATPVFIVGMPRSGTSLTEQIIASHPDAFGAGEMREMSVVFKRLYGGDPRAEGLEALTMRDMSDFDLIKLGGSYMRILREKNGGEFKYSTDKMPQNFLNLPAIRRVFPHAKIVHTMRNPVDNCISIYSKNFSGHHDYSYTQKELGHYYCNYVEMMEHWNAVMPGKIYNLQYEELVSDFENQVRSLLEFCEIPFHENCLKPHETKRVTRTASASQVVKPIYTSSVEKWRRYEPWIGELLEALAPVYTPPETQQELHQKTATGG